MNLVALPLIAWLMSALCLRFYKNLWLPAQEAKEVFKIHKAFRKFEPKGFDVAHFVPILNADGLVPCPDKRVSHMGYDRAGKFTVSHVPKRLEMG